MEWGFGSSPVIHKGKFIIQCDVTGEDFLGLYEVKTGEEIWKVQRDEVSTWCSPAVYEKDGKTQITINENHEITALVASFNNIEKKELERLVWKWRNGFNATVKVISALISPGLHAQRLRRLLIITVNPPIGLYLPEAVC